MNTTNDKVSYWRTFNVVNEGLYRDFSTLLDDYNQYYKLKESKGETGKLDLLAAD